MNVYISENTSCPILRVDDKTAAKMFEVYLEQTVSKQIFIGPAFDVSVLHSEVFPIKLETTCPHLSLDVTHSRQLRQALFDAETCVKENK
jgi:hypothetical protein